MSQQQEPSRFRWGAVLRVAVTVALLAVAIPHIDLPQIPRRAQDAVWWWLGLAVTGSVVGVVLSAWRWQWVLRALDAKARLGQLVTDCLAGQFVSNFLPSTVGGDLVRITRLSRATGSTVSFASVVLERLSGWVALPVLTLIGLAIDARLRGLGTATVVAAALAAGTLVLLLGVLAVASSDRAAGRFTRSDNALRFIGAVHLGIRRLTGRPRTLAGLLLAAAAYQLTTVLTVYLAAHALGVELSLTAALVFGPAVAMIQVLPISFNGLGVREGAFVLFLRPLGATTTQAIGVGLLVYAVTVAVSLLGAPAFAAGRRTAGATA